MAKLEVFFDYACPFCKRGHEYLKELRPSYPELELVWRPCEAHPRPDRYGLHSDLCIRGMFFALDRGADIWDYHERMFKAALGGGVDIENIDALSESVRGLLDVEEFRKALKSGEYERTLEESNRYAYEQSGVWAVPSYRMNGRKLDSIENIGVTKEQLKEFIDAAEKA